jgi:hypothetical protein
MHTLYPSCIHILTPLVPQVYPTSTAGPAQQCRIIKETSAKQVRHLPLKSKTPALTVEENSGTCRTWCRGLMSESGCVRCCCRSRSRSRLLLAAAGVGVGAGVGGAFGVGVAAFGVCRWSLRSLQAALEGATQYISGPPLSSHLPMDVFSLSQEINTNKGNPSFEVQT